MNEKKVNILPDKYPTDVKFSDQYSFFCIGLQHNIYDPDCEIDGVITPLQESGWKVHPSLLEISNTKRFSIFTPQVDASFYGLTKPYGATKDEEKTFETFIKERIDSSKGDKKAAETIFLRKLEGKKHSFQIGQGAESEKFEFELHWFDLWLFPDGAGVFTFKADLKGERNISRLAKFHRHLRDVQRAVIQTEKAESRGLWENTILEDCLKSGSCLGLDSIDITLFFDPYQKSAKVLMAAQLETALSDVDSLAWGRPLMDPPISLNAEHKRKLSEGEWDITLNAASASVIAGYATVRDMLLFELATVSDEGAALGWNGDPGFQYSAEYVRQMIDGQFVEVWEHWNALMLRDSCVMLSFDPSMPLVANQYHPEKIGQAEDRYYPLYVLTYHLRYALDKMSEELIDSNLSDAIKSRELREKFVRFRNQHWFHEVTTDFLGREVYEKMKFGIGVGDAYDAVRDEVDMVNSYIREKWAAYTAGLIAVWSIVSTVSGLSNGWWYILTLTVVIVIFCMAIFKQVPIALKLRNWLVNKLKSFYKKILALDLMRGA